MTSSDVPLVKEDESCYRRIESKPTQCVLADQTKSITLYEDDIVDLARLVYYFGYLFPPAMQIAYQTLKGAKSGHASVVRDCIVEPRLSLCRIEQLLKANGFDLSSLK